MVDWLRYEVVVPVEGAPDNPEIYAIETYDADLMPTLIYRQEGFEGVGTDLSINLTTLVALGELAQEIIDGRAVPADGSE